MTESSLGTVCTMLHARGQRYESTTGTGTIVHRERNGKGHRAVEREDTRHTGRAILYVHT